VPREYIILAQNKVPKDGDTKAGTIVFENPRLGAGFKGHEFVGNGLSKEDVEELRTSIKNNGLDHAILTRPNNGKLEVVDGYRRLLQLDYLVKSGIPVRDKVTRTMVPASELYAKGIPCRIEEMSDIDAYRRANDTDASSVNHGDAVKLAQVRYFAKAGASDSDILLATGKTKEWLTRIKPVAVALDIKSFTAFAKGLINFTVAEYLSQFDTVSARHTALKALLERVDERQKEAVADAELHLANSKGKLTKAKTEAQIASHSGDRSKEKAAEQAVKTAEGNIATAEDNVRVVKKRVAQVTKRDIPRASNPRAGGRKSTAGEPDGINKPLTRAKLEKHWGEPAKKAVHALKKGELNGDVDENIHPEFYFVVSLLVDKIAAGESNLARIGKLYTKQAKERGGLSKTN
jgi:ParB-like chromosome segregation protein Spo0J